MIKHIIFDLGNVLVELHPEKAFAAFSKYCKSAPEQLQRFFLSQLHLDFMAGKVEPEALHFQLSSEYNCDLTFDQFVDAWNMVIGKTKPGISELFSLLKEKYQISICSNVDPLHWQFCIDSYPELQIPTAYFLSFEMGLNKPDRRIFEKMLVDLKAQPQECFFIDDTFENISMAVNMGYETIHSPSPEFIREELIGMNIING